MATQVIPFKRATTFYATCTYQPETGGPSDLSGLTITSDIRDANGTIYSCTVAINNSNQFSVSYADSSNWAIGTAYWDIKFSNNGVVFFSDTIVLNIIKNVTIE